MDPIPMVERFLPPTYASVRMGWMDALMKLGRRYLLQFSSQDKSNSSYTNWSFTRTGVIVIGTWIPPSDNHHATALVALNTSWVGGDLILRRNGVETRMGLKPRTYKKFEISAL
jgi:hypothetical protein